MDGAPLQGVPDRLLVSYAGLSGPRSCCSGRSSRGGGWSGLSRRCATRLLAAVTEYADLHRVAPVHDQRLVGVPVAEHVVERGVLDGYCPCFLMTCHTGEHTVNAWERGAAVVEVPVRGGTRVTTVSG